jgi:hypothetical protein
LRTQTRRAARIIIRINSIFDVLCMRNNESNLEGVKDDGSKFERKKEKKTNRSGERKKRRKESFLPCFCYD